MRGSSSPVHFVGESFAYVLRVAVRTSASHRVGKPIEDISSVATWPAFLRKDGRAEGDAFTRVASLDYPLVLASLSDCVVYGRVSGSRTVL